MFLYLYLSWFYSVDNTLSFWRIMCFLKFKKWSAGIASNIAASLWFSGGTPINKCWSLSVFQSVNESLMLLSSMSFLLHFYWLPWFRLPVFKFLLYFAHLDSITSVTFLIIRLYVSFLKFLILHSCLSLFHFFFFSFNIHLTF